MTVYACSYNENGRAVEKSDGNPSTCTVTTDGCYPSVEKSGYKPFLYDNGDDYVSDGLYRIVDKDGKIGYANENHRVIISPRFAFGFPFENGRAKVTDSGHLAEVPGSNGEYHYWSSNNWYYIDKTGKKLELTGETDTTEGTNCSMPDAKQQP